MLVGVAPLPLSFPPSGIGRGSGSRNIENTGKYRSSGSRNTKNVQYRNFNSIEYRKKYQYRTSILPKILGFPKNTEILKSTAFSRKKIKMKVLKKKFQKYFVIFFEIFREYHKI